MLVESWPIERPIPYARNARKIPPTAVDKVAASIKEFGWRQPIVVDEAGVLIAGHCRLLAAQKLRLTQVPVHVATGLSESQVKAYRLMDNRSHDDATWDVELLAIELSDLQGLAVDLSLTGFDAEEIAEFLSDATPGLTDPDETPAAPAVPVSALGDVWQLGNHRLVCGDSTEAATVEKCLDGVAPHLMVTDPPYGVSYDPTWRSDNKGKAGKVRNDDRADWREAWALFPGNIAYVWHGGLHAGTVADSLIACDFKLRAQIIWVKDRFAMSRGDYHWQHEPCWYGVRGTGSWKGDRKQTTTWNIKAREDGGHGHGTQKPVECMRRPIENNSSPGQAIYEPFSGSGTTIIAAEQTRRCCHAIELDPVYVDVAITRWQNFTGKEAKLVGGGTFQEEAEARKTVA